MVVYLAVITAYAVVLTLTAVSITQFIKWQRRKANKRVLVTVLDDGGQVLGREKVLLRK